MQRANTLADGVTVPPGKSGYETLAFRMCLNKGRCSHCTRIYSSSFTHGMLLSSYTPAAKRALSRDPPTPKLVGAMLVN
jgi:hypothetical protein